MKSLYQRLSPSLKDPGCRSLHSIRVDDGSINVKPSPKFTESHIADMKKQLLSLARAKTAGRLCNSAFYRIPTAESFEVETQPYNLFLESLGIKLRLPSKFLTSPTRFGHMNRYMIHTIKRIRKHVRNEEYKKAGAIALYNIRNSHSFRISALNHVCSGGYYNMALSNVIRICHDVNKIIVRNDSKLDYKRVYIEKANGKWRPLGVPKPEGRVVLHLGNGFLQEILKSEVTDSQHAYLPGRGVLTAGTKVLEYVKIYKYVYETDLTNFFPSVNVGHVLNIMYYNYEAPREVYDFFLGLSASLPKLPEEKLLDESKFDVKSTVDGQPVELYLIDKGKEGKMLTDMIPEVPGQDVELSFLNFGIIPGGFPQGMPCSPLLSIVILRKYINQNPFLKCVAYADDFLFFGHEPFEVVDSPLLGIVHSPAKCGGIIYNGKGTVKGLKFLGFRLLPDGWLTSETRSGVKCMIHGLFTKFYAKEYSIAREIEAVESISDIHHLAASLKEEEKPTVSLSSEDGVGRNYSLELLENGPNLRFDLIDKDKIKEDLELTEDQYQDLLIRRNGTQKQLQEERDFLDQCVVSNDSLNSEEIDDPILNNSPLMENLESIPFSKTRKQLSSLLKLAKTNLFGFIASCMVIQDGKNDHSYEDNIKAVRNMLGRLNPNSLLKRVPKNTDSSGAIGTLARIMDQAMLSKSQVTRKRELIGYAKSLKHDMMGPPHNDELKELRRQLSKKRYRTRGNQIRRLPKDLTDSLK